MKTKFLYLTLMLGFILKVNGQVTGDGLVGYWPLNGNAYDMSGNQNDATINTAIITEGRFGNPNQAYYFNGVDSKIIIDTNNLGIYDRLTVCCWINTSYENDQFIVSKYDWSIDKGYHLIINKNGYASINGRDSNGEYITCADTVKIVNDGNWHFLVGIIDKGIWKIYVDGDLQNEINTNHNNVCLTTDIPLSIGFHDVANSSNDRYFNGSIDDTRLYNKALSTTEITQLYNEHKCFETIYDTVVTEVFDTTHITIYDSVSVTSSLVINLSTNRLPLSDNKNSIIVYPNPAKDIIYINTGENFGEMNDYKIKIINTAGSVIFESFITDQLFEINVNNFEQHGLYLINIIDNTNQVVETRKLILN